MSVDVIALTGLPGSGKSTVAPLLARLLGWRCADIDALIEQSHGKPAGAVLADQGEQAFRAIERDLLHEVLAGQRPVVIACGGGLLADPGARAVLLRQALVVWLDAADDVLLGRLDAAAGRPLLQPEPAARLIELRAERFEAHAAAHVRVEAAPDPHLIAQNIAMLAASERIDIPGHVHHVHTGEGLLSRLAEHVPADATTVALVHDAALADAATVADAALEAHGIRCVPLAVEGGEGAKTWNQAGSLLESMAAAKLRRHDCVVALGGGSIGDLGGFAASTYQRGVRWITVPTTLLAMVDSAIGGKTGVDLDAGKNLAGTFWQPHAVLCDISLLASLGERSYRCAVSEIVKYAMLFGDPLASLLDSDLDSLLARHPGAITAVVRMCCALKARVVEADEREASRRALLNYGHTVGHAVEAASRYAVLHGEAVAVGLRAAGLLSTRMLGCPDTDIAWQESVLRRAGLGQVDGVEVRDVQQCMSMDKKSRSGETRWVLLERRGSPVAGVAIPDAAVRDALHEVLSV